MEKFKLIIDKWFSCEITGDNAIGQVATALKDRGNKDEIINAHIEEELQVGN